ncbi:hypothetical protein [Thiomicrorhabdus arctica]|jgi:uncharacterized coiled-coil protein SlyX|uniref:hypothetical protein n=1 Tax=Thiomicrorhabdus arctica TaxID=131540 RepID=UPI00037772B3|nr:hypothetical protein [Thiomicrorhabdus arctica]
MVRYRVLIPLFLSLFVWQGVADAASISTRVRVLESKVAKQDSKIKQSEYLRRAQDSKIDKSLAKVKVIEKKVDKLLKGEEGVERKSQRADKRYAFP